MGTLSTAVERVHLATTAVLSGLVVVDPTRGLRAGGDWASWVTGQQRLDRVMSRIAPPLFLSTAAAAAAAVVSVGEDRPVRAASRGVAAGCVVAAIVVTLRSAEPVNERLRTWRADGPPEPGWREDRARWDHAHRVRRVLLAVGAGATVTGVVLG